MILLRGVWYVSIIGLGLAGCAPPATPARSFLHSDETLPHLERAAGYLILTARPTTEDRDRVLAMCEAYLRTLEPLSSLDVDPNEVFLTHWPLASSRWDTVVEECPTLLEHYDFARVVRIADESEVWGVRGPVLVAYPPPQLTGEAGRSEILVWDLSDFSIADVDRAFHIWKDRIAQDPSVWHDGFDIIVLRERVRNFLERYSPDIIRIIPSS